ncbi:Reaction center protein H chain [Rhodobacteraceae bacterium THAF1]|uniref:photosynthetic reaction center subunit H n=1 Tax=Palleronia sp. THAF1 TaxID=2587842 RepID=UPI000F411458|nr:photosynthetic reaction center subunit H [Palleronia sp. THAF1]QFU10262.1 Reaction center protein H chain [Palleronia sp. THAF1]VDC16833.1 Reaction center protein H chain [Rhodobacteraceae bacterium THAF1]
MVGVEFFGDTDLAAVAIWGFWLFFALLIYYLQTENMREGYPLEKDDGSISPNQGPFPVPAPKTFIMPEGVPDVTVPSAENELRHARAELALARTAQSEGFPHAPIGDPMLDGVGPASWVPRADRAERDGEGHIKIQPMSKRDAFFVSAGRDPRGMPVVANDDQVVGEVTDLWIDIPEQLIRYLQIKLETGQTVLAPIQLVRVTARYVDVRTLNTERMAQVPQTASMEQITLLEEEKITAFYGGGELYCR